MQNVDAAKLRLSMVGGLHLDANDRSWVMPHAQHGSSVVVICCCDWDDCMQLACILGCVFTKRRRVRGKDCAALFCGSSVEVGGVWNLVAWRPS